MGFSGIVNAPVGPIGALRALGMTLLVVLATQGLQLLVAGSFMAVRGSDLTEAVARVAEHPLSLATAQLLGFVVILRWALRALLGEHLRLVAVQNDTSWPFQTDTS